MANNSFTKPMTFNEEETKRLFEFLESTSEPTYRVKTSPAEKASEKLLKDIFEKSTDKK